MSSTIHICAQKAGYHVARGRGDVLLIVFCLCYIRRELGKSNGNLVSPSLDDGLVGMSGPSKVRLGENMIRKGNPRKANGKEKETRTVVDQKESMTVS
jgi:hypothetical protein